MKSVLPTWKPPGLHYRSKDKQQLSIASDRSRANGKFHPWFVPEEQRPDGFAAEGKVRPRTWATGTWAGAELRRAFEAWAVPFGGFPGQPGRPTLRIRQLRNK